MGLFILTGEAPFGRPNDTVEVEVDGDAVSLVHHGATEAARRNSGHSGHVYSWTYPLPVAAIQEIRIESAQGIGEKQALLSRLFGPRIEPGAPASERARLVIDTRLHGKRAAVVLKGEPKDLECLERKLLAARMRVAPWVE